MVVFKCFILPLVATRPIHKLFGCNFNIFSAISKTTNKCTITDKIIAQSLLTSKGLAAGVKTFSFLKFLGIHFSRQKEFKKLLNIICMFVYNIPFNLFEYMFVKLAKLSSITVQKQGKLMFCKSCNKTYFYRDCDCVRFMFFFFNTTTKTTAFDCVLTFTG